jgi:hypothetical protein
MRRVALLGPALLAGCAAAPPTEIPVHGETPGYTCRNVNFEAFVGQTATSELGARMLAASGARTLRWVRFGAMVTMEFSASRLTVRLDPQGGIASATCG